MVDYASLADTAQRLINEDGRDVILRKLDETPADPNKPWRAGGTNNTDVGPLKAVLVPFRSQDVDGTFIRRGDKKVLVAANDTNPELIEKFDTLIEGTDPAGSDTWKIEEVKAINPGDVRVIYIMQVRK